MFELFSNPKEKPFLWVGMGIGLLLIAILKTYLH